MDVVTLGQAKLDAAKRYAQLQAHRMVSAGGIAVAGNCHASALDTPTNSTAGTSRCPHTIGVDCSDLRLVFTNWFSSSSNPYYDADGTATYTVNASIEIGGTRQAGGTIYRVTFGGRTSATIDPGGMIVSDPLGIEFAQGDVIYSRTFISATTWYSNKRSGNVLDAGGWTATTDLTAPGSALVAGAANTRLYVPAAIIGTPKVTTAKALLLSGHSILHGYFGDNGGNPFPSFGTEQPARTSGGWSAKGTRGVIGTINVALDSQRVSQFTAPVARYRRSQMARYCTHVLMQNVTNDLSQSVNLATNQANVLAEAALWTRRGLKALVCTEFPHTSSTDAFITTGAQTPFAQESVRVAYNDWVRAGCPVNASTGVAVAVGTAGALLAGQPGHPISGFMDPSDQVETARNSGLWLPAARIVTDAAITSGQQVVTSPTANFATADVGLIVAIAGAGTAGGYLVGAISSVVPGTSATVANPASVTVSGATAGVGVMVSDGVHPSARASILAANGFDLTKIT